MDKFRWLVFSFTENLVTPSLVIWLCGQSILKKSFGTILGPFATALFSQAIQILLT